jgi:hypothetical protein
MTPTSTSQDDRAWAARLHRWGLADVAPVFIDVLRPLGAVGGQLLMLASPLVTTFMSQDRLDQLVETLDDPERLDQFLHSLEHGAEE